MRVAPELRRSNDRASRANMKHPLPPRSCHSPLVTAALLGAVGCAAPPRPLVVPDIISVVSHYAGDPVGGSMPHAAALGIELQTADAFELRGTLYLLAEVPEGAFESLTEQVRLIVNEGEADPVGASPLVTPGSSVVWGDRAASLAKDIGRLGKSEGVLIASFEGLSLPSVTSRMVAVLAQPVELNDPRAADRRVGVELWREDPLQAATAVALVISDLVEGIEDLADESGPEVIQRARKQTLILDQPLLAGGQPLVILSPARFDVEGRIFTALVLEASPPIKGERALAALDERVERLRSEVRDAALDDNQRRQQLRVGEQQRLRRVAAIDSLGDPVARRAAIVDLAGNAGATLATELAVMANEQVLESLGGRLVANEDSLRSLSGDPAAFGWRLERESLLLFIEELAEGSLPPEYDALLLRFTGEAGRYAGALEDALASCESIEEFYARILQENRIALEDSSPAGRVRAYDWLLGLGLEVPGFDPLAGNRERRAALRAWREAEAAAEAVAISSVAEDPR